MTPPRPERAGVDRAPKLAREIVRDIDMGKQICGGRFGFEWPATSEFSGAFTAYCAEPNCMTTGECTGPRFVPQYPQYTKLDENSPLHARRALGGSDPRKGVRETIEGLRIVQKMAEARGAKRDTRPIGEIIRYAGRVLKKLQQQIRGEGWTSLP